MNQEKALALAEDIISVFVKYELTYQEAIEICEETINQLELMAKCQRMG